MDKNREKAYNIRSCALLCEILVRTSRDRKNQTKTFKSILKSGPSFDLKVSDLIKRREKGYSLDADSVLREISQAGYNSPQEMMDAYTKATKLAEDLRWIVFRYRKLSEYEKEILSQD